MFGWVPAPGVLRAMAARTLSSEDQQTLDSPEDDNETDTIRESRASIELKLYNNSSQTDNVPMNGDGTVVTYTNVFKYLGTLKHEADCHH